MSYLGNIFLSSACMLCLTYSFVQPIYYRSITNTIFACLLGAMTVLMYCHITNDFLLENVYSYSHTTKPLIYKICGVWGNKEGSMLLWVFILTLYLLLIDIVLPSCIDISQISRQSNGIIYEYIQNLSFKTLSLITHGMICFYFLIFVLLISNPFMKTIHIYKDGLGLNPILQDFGLAIHPPILYLGYLGFSVPFSLSIAGLIKNIEGKIWAKIVMPWMTLSCALLTLGIGLGSWWAYRELGWGGFWFWDPVENISLMPWLIAVATTHLLLIVQKFNLFKNLAIFLTIIIFLLSVMGTFLVRSGILLSVHTFAHDAKYGLYILLLLIIITISSIIIFLVFTRCYITDCTGYKTKKIKVLFSKMTLIIMNNLLFITVFFILFIGTTYPIILEYFTGERISVGAPYYNSLLSPIALIILLFMIMSQYCHWQEKSMIFIFHDYRFTFCIMLSIIPFIYHMKIIIILSMTLSLGLLASILESYSKKISLFKRSFYQSILISKHISWSYYAMMLAHAGIAILIFGISDMIGWQEKKEQYLKIGDSIMINKFRVTLRNVEYIQEKHYHGIRGIFDIKDLLNHKILGYVTPEYRIYLVEGKKNLESSIYHNIMYDIYVVIGEIDHTRNKIASKVYYKPGMSIIWCGTAMITCGYLIVTFLPFKTHYRIKT
ncbi:heme lyase CcmF/NrfE family subunit [Wolbachia endosymbiont of Howardula sp.]|uniref:heme lyase CcmF/NrfE family subunit n=1 Tax=Wolbachia endosymbiont of Howardula sp. TaxID=2916816 RepID=UPI00217E22A8|nr:heme lyase CcmF/NrfE family subunit [Wolbachia endosymbiont of Howardula sp.]UWI82966.1 heme lyase CcmF/NrfE family subunit [Wolbachia endosymbiont of Howardula sp.]